MKSAIGRDRLRELLNYEPETGVFTWRIARGTQRRGAVAGAKNQDGYLQIQIERKLYSAHRLAWLYIIGEWPAAEIDHINGDKADNRFANLRRATRSENMANTPRLRNNTHGFKGVSPNRGRWVARIRHLGKHHHIGCFATPEAAHDAYVAKAKEIFGAFVRTS